MSLFEHLSVFISIILGLAVVHLLGGLSLILDARVRARLYWVHLGWTFNLLFLTVLVWIGNFLIADVTIFSIWHFLNLVLYAMFIYLMTGLLYPIGGSEVTDFRQHFFANRVRFCAVGLAFVATDAIDGLLEAQAVDGSLNPGQFGTLAVYALLFGIGIRTDREGFHGSAVVIFFLGLLGFLFSLVDVGLVSS